LGLKMRPDGYVRVVDLLNLQQISQELRRMNAKDNWLNVLQEIVANCQKQRFSLTMIDSSWHMRANQGHTMKKVTSESLLQSITSKDIWKYPKVVHGTYRKVLKPIIKQGLSRMRRNHVHFGTSDCFKGNLSGFRSNSQLLVYLNLEKAIDEGLKFYISENNVVLCPGDEKGFIPSKYFKYIKERVWKGGVPYPGKVLWKPPIEKEGSLNGFILPKNPYVSALMESKSSPRGKQLKEERADEGEPTVKDPIAELFIARPDLHKERADEDEPAVKDPIAELLDTKTDLLKENLEADKLSGDPTAISIETKPQSHEITVFCKGREDKPISRDRKMELVNVISETNEELVEVKESDSQAQETTSAGTVKEERAVSEEKDLVSTAKQEVEYPKPAAKKKKRKPKKRKKRRNNLKSNEVEGSKGSMTWEIKKMSESSKEVSVVVDIDRKKGSGRTCSLGNVNLKKVSNSRNEMDDSKRNTEVHKEGAEEQQL